MNLTNITANLFLRMQLKSHSIKVGDSLCDVGGNGIWDDVEIPERLVVTDGEGHFYRTGKTEYGPQDMAGIFLYPMDKKSGPVQSLLVQNDAGRYKIALFPI